jgi:deoxyadenosine/deoxycytidine kinase
MFIVFCGLPASGKTTIINRLKELFKDLIIVPEHNEWVNGNFPPKPTNIEEKIKKQEFFLDLDIKRYEWAKERLDNKLVVSDTDFLSPISHNYAERALIPDLNIYNWIVENYTKALNNGLLGLPDLYIYLDSKPENRLLKREQSLNETGRKRNDIFFTEPFPTLMRDFYYRSMSPLSEEKCLPSFWYNNDEDQEQSIKNIQEFISNFSVVKSSSNIEILNQFLAKTI